MNLILAFLPFFSFALVDRFAGATAGLIAGSIVAAGMLIRDRWRGRRSVRILEVGTLVLFAGLALYALVVQPDWSILGVRLRVDLGLLAIVLGSMAIGRPFTREYAKEHVDPSMWNSARFLRTTMLVSGVWAVAFVVLILADLLMIYRSDIPISVGVLVSIGALVGAAKFTGWYPLRVRSMNAASNAKA